MKKILVAIILILFSTQIIACKNNKPEKPAEKDNKTIKPTPTSLTPEYGGTIISASIGDASVLLPPLASDSASFDIIGLVYDTVLKYDKDLNLIGELAESWEVKNDGKEIVFHFYKNIKWHDGKPFTADDVIFTYNVIVDPKTPTAYSGQYKDIEKITKIDDYTVSVKYKISFAPALSSWAGFQVIPKHLLQGKDITKSPLRFKPIGTGPYKFVKWKTGDRILLKANKEYFAGSPYINNYLYRVIPDQATIFLELKAGGIDESGLTPLQFVRQTNTKSFKEKFNKFNYIGFNYTYLGYNLKKELFKDKRVRQAISYAINKEEIISSVLYKQGIVATGPYKPGTWYYNPNVKKYEYNINKAKQLLKDSGWIEKKKDGILYKNNKPFEFTLMTNQGNKQRNLAAEIIQQRLKEVGIKMNIRIIEWSSFINEFINKRKFDAIILGWGLDTDPDQYDIWSSTKTKPEEFNFISYNNKEVDKILDEARHTFNKEKRKLLYYKFQEILAEEQPYTFLYVPYSLVAVNKKIKGITPAPAGISYNFTKWYIPKKLQRAEIIK